MRRWGSCRKLLALASLAYAFLLDLLGDGAAPCSLLPALLRWTHRSGRPANHAWRCRYRLCAVLTAPWNRHTPSFHGCP